MKKLLNKFKNFKLNKSGATAVEYGLIAALLSIVIITAVGLVGRQVNGTFSKVSSSLSSANG